MVATIADATQVAHERGIILKCGLACARGGARRLGPVLRGYPAARLAVARSPAGGPRSLRNQVRDPVTYLDRAKLVEYTRTAKIKVESVQMLVSLAERLRDARGDERVLRDAGGMMPASGRGDRDV